ncbi:MAG: hypothetical protein KBC05_17870, partial [Candidatus Hydrogenedentes bacterium]|nr:hypothetical protein [Candidatus Hydrogenedentota bacterium]
MKKLIAAVAMFCFAGCDLALASTYVLDLEQKQFTYEEPMVLAETATVILQGISNAAPEGIIVYMSNRESAPLAMSTNFVAYGTNGTAASGTLNLATTNLQAEFAGSSPNREKEFTMSVWDSGNHTMLGLQPVVVKNNPMADQLIAGWTNIPASLTNEMWESIAAAIAASANAQEVASNAWDLAYGVATTNEPLWTAASNRVLYVGDVASVAYGTATNEAYRGDWGEAISNAAVLRSIATVPASDAYSAAASESLPFVVTNSGALTLSGLTAGSIGIRLTTTNASGIALYAAVVKDGDGEIVATVHPACDGTEQSIRWPWNASETLTVEATGIASPAEGAESAIVTAAQVETWADVSLAGKTNDLADQHLYVDYPAATNEAANRAYADDAADAALALALGEIATATFNRDLAGYVQRWNPRFDTVAASNSLSTLYGGSTALRLDGAGAAVVPEIRAFAVEAGEVATLTVWSYSGGATNLVPEVTTNLITGTWEQK